MEVLRSTGQSVVAPTENGLVPGAEAADVVRIGIGGEGAVLQEAA